jgi:type I restriction enzyme M protein
LEHAVELFGAESAAKNAAKKAKAALDRTTLDKYGDLTESDVKALVLDDKWGATITRRVDGVLTSLVVNLVARTQVLGDRYGRTVEELDSSLASFDEKVSEHLAAMGFT